MCNNIDFGQANSFLHISSSQAIKSSDLFFESHIDSNIESTHIIS